jgi:AcrR family transcriptional regulator
VGADALIHQLMINISLRRAGPAVKYSSFSENCVQRDKDTSMTVKRPRTVRRARRGRPLKNDATPDMRERILDAAEDHFSRHGFWGVTIREVAQDAKVDTALLHYYFDTKRGMFDAVFARRAEIINRERIDSIDAYETAAGDAITAEGVINAFLQPILERAAQGDQRWHNYFALIAQVNNTPAWGGETMARTFDPVIHRLIRALRKALPDASEENLYWSYHFLSGALTLSLSQTGRIDRLSNGLCKSSDFGSIGHRMAPFIASGFERLCKPAGRALARRAVST